MSHINDWNSRRSTVHGTRGMVGASQPLAAQAGLQVLVRGGNAADAAVATAAVLAVTEPCSTGLGGDAFVLWYDAATKTVQTINGSGRAPAALTLELARGVANGKSELPTYHAHTITVPGACAAWCELHATHGSGKLSLRDLLADAIHHAREGFPVAPITAYFWAGGAQRQLGNSPGGKELMIDGRAPRAGERFRNPGMAAALSAIADGGADAFYRGDIAQRIAATVQRHGGVLTADDLAAHTSTHDAAISAAFGGVRLHECPPNGQGLTALLALNTLRQLGADDPARLGEPGTVQRWHVIIEALRLAFADARAHIADPSKVEVPTARLLSDAHTAEQAKRIGEKAMADPRLGQPERGSETVYFSVVDAAGNAVSMVNSNYMGFGTGIVPDGLGFSLQNRGHNFSLDAAHPNVLAPGKRPYHTIIPAMLTRDGSGELVASYGVMGGFMQPQGHVQVLLNLVLDGMDEQAALDAPRICIHAESDLTRGGRIAVEDGVPDAVIAGLLARGHNVYRVSGAGRALFGRGQIIRRNADGVLSGGSDPRADGQVVAW
ncbi:MAG: gamma-glutamyltransferase family protein [Planctomycetota bacterium]